MTTSYSNNYTQAFVITPSAVLGIAGPNRADGKPTPYCNGFVTDTDGTVTVFPKEGPHIAVAIPVIAGVIVPLGIRQLAAVSTSMTVVGLI